MPYNIKQLGEKSVSIDFFIADPTFKNLLSMRAGGYSTTKKREVTALLEYFTIY